MIVDIEVIGYNIFQLLLLVTMKFYNRRATFAHSVSRRSYVLTHRVLYGKNIAAQKISSVILALIHSRHTKLRLSVNLRLYDTLQRAYTHHGSDSITPESDRFLRNTRPALR